MDKPGAPLIRQLEVRPLWRVPTSEAIDASRAWLTEQRAASCPVKAGHIFSVAGQEFAVVSCSPVSSGGLAASCDFTIATVHVPALARLQLTCLHDESELGVSQGSLFSDFVRPQLLKLRAQARAQRLSSLVTLELNRVWVAGDKEFGVRALDPGGRYGVLTEDTEVFITYVESQALSRVHVLPYADTLPGAYTVDLFKDFLQPFFQAHPFEMYGAEDIFAYRGVRFRVVATDPPHVAARIGTRTLVFSEGEPLRPTIWDRIPPELQGELRQMPRGLQILMLNTMAGDEAMQRRLTEVDQILQRGQGLGSEELSGCGQRVTWDAEGRAGDKQQQCMVCLSEFADGEELRELSCGHLFHCGCVDEWLQRSAVCPICKRRATSSSSQASGSAGTESLPEGTKVLRGEQSGEVIAVDEPSQRMLCRFEISTGEAADPESEEAMLSGGDVTQPLEGVVLFGLQAAELNGKVCRIVGGYDSQSGRYKLQLEDGSKVVAIRPENCILPQGCLARVEGLSAGGPGQRWNGRYGRITQFDEQRTRHTIQMVCGGERLSVRPKNLRA